jgi:hypothetical protein
VNFVLLVGGANIILFQLLFCLEMSENNKAALLSSVVLNSTGSTTDVVFTCSNLFPPECVESIFTGLNLFQPEECVKGSSETAVVCTGFIASPSLFELVIAGAPLLTTPEYVESIFTGSNIFPPEECVEGSLGGAPLLTTPEYVESIFTGPNLFQPEECVEGSSETAVVCTGFTANPSFFEQVIAGAPLLTTPAAPKKRMRSFYIKEPQKFRLRPFYNKERKLKRKLANTRRVLEQTRTQQPTNVSKVILTEFSGVSETTALRSALAM